MENNTTEVPVNKHYKDTVFRSLFNEKNTLLSLYNAIIGTNYANPDDLSIVTLENVIYMKHKDDIACTIDLQLALFEHQSSVNPNMPLRYLRYSVDLFAKLTVGQNIYSKHQILLPNPTFVVLYNGTEPQPERKIMRLSDSYMGVSNDRESNLELIVTQLNINDGFNEDLKQKCPELFGYCHFVSLVRSYMKEADSTIEQAVDKAIDTCIDEDILSDFLKANRKDVKEMSIY